MKNRVSYIIMLLVIIMSVFSVSIISTHVMAGTEKHEEEGHKEGGKEDAHEHEEKEEVVRFSDAELKEFGITIDRAGSGKLHVYVEATGEIKPDPDLVSHLVPRVSGIVSEVRKKVGDWVKEGEIMAIIESRELADAKSAYLTARERFKLAEFEFKRKERLWKEKIVAEKDYLKAKKMFAEAQIELMAREQKLHALGLTDADVKGLKSHKDVPLTRYELISPIDGVVLERHITKGEFVSTDMTVFKIADLSRVWILLAIYEKDIPYVREGQKAIVEVGYGTKPVRCTLSYVAPVIDEKTRTVAARCVASNKKGLLRPGTFIRAKIDVESIDVGIVVPKTAVHTFRGKTVVFVRTSEGFVPREVVTGRSDAERVEIVKGLEPGEEYASKGGFTIKAEFKKAEFGEGHSH
ncbi:MAG TPA: efflux RND transporter periplasmic adaptor subunit [Deltaproteobacteria bacterium]|nr:efflux RND transporter periplasmic adaptor subunit [Deltaproteobacteria bacterium]